jgi:hypothetical protein
VVASPAENPFPASQADTENEAHESALSLVENLPLGHVAHEVSEEGVPDVKPRPAEQDETLNDLQPVASFALLYEPLHARHAASCDGVPD